MAQWSISPLAKILYVLKGKDSILKLGGVLLFLLSIFNAVVLSGIRPTSSSSSSVRSISVTPDGGPFVGYLDVTNIANTSRGLARNNRDQLMELAALVSLSNVSAPASSFCAGQDATQCSVKPPPRRSEHGATSISVSTHST